MSLIPTFLHPPVCVRVMNVHQHTTYVHVHLSSLHPPGESAGPRINRQDGVIVNNRVDVQQPGRVVIYYCFEGTDWYFPNGTVVPEFSSDSGSLYQYQKSGGDSRILYFDPFTSILQGYYFCFKNSNLSTKVSHVGVFLTLNLGRCVCGGVFMCVGVYVCVCDVYVRGVCVWVCTFAYNYVIV